MTRNLNLMLLVAAFLLARAASAAEPDPGSPALGEVLEATSGWADPTARVIATRLVVALRACEGRRCPERVTLWVRGGRIGQEEQRVQNLRVPAAGDEVALVFTPQGHVELKPGRAPR